jgi:hypothetical protein
LRKRSFKVASAEYIEITDLTLEPEVAGNYLLEQSASLSRLVQSGIAGGDPFISEAAGRGGRTVTLPFWDDLSGNSSVATDNETEITSGQMTSDYDQAQKDYRTKSWKSPAVIPYVAGSDPIAAMLDRYAQYWVREEQTILLQKFAGVFGASSMAVLVNDISSEDGDNAVDANLIDSDAIIDTMHKNGDHWDMFKALCMHSVPFKRLQKLDLIDFEPTSEQNVQIPYYLGREVMVDDGMTATAGSTSGYKYSTFLFAKGSIARADCPIKEPIVEVVYKPLEGTGAATYEVVTRRDFILHPRGIRCAVTLTTNNMSPTNAQLATGTNWTLAALQKNVGIAKLVTNG